MVSFQLGMVHRREKGRPERTRNAAILLSPGVLDWKFGSSRQVENIFLRRSEGVQLRPLERTIRALPVRPDWIYYEVVQNDSPAWKRCGGHANARHAAQGFADSQQG